MNPEKTGEYFSSELMLKARKEVKKKVNQLANLIKPGMSEPEAHDELKKILPKTLWHPSKIRFGPNTWCSFKDKSNEDIRLKEDDLFFIDIGPVFYEHEADYGQTFTMGEPSEDLIKLQTSPEKIFNLVHQQWHERKLSGEEIYQVCERQANQLGLELNLGMHGHRLSDFPHARYHRGGLREHSEPPGGVFMGFGDSSTLS